MQIDVLVKNEKHVKQSIELWIRTKACGIDKVTREKYEQNLEENLENLVKK